MFFDQSRHRRKKIFDIYIDIYIEIAKAFPKRILAIYLRSVKHKKKMIRVKNLADSYNEVPVLLVKDSNEAKAHAKKSGFIV